MVSFNTIEEQPTKLDDLFKYQYIVYDHRIFMSRYLVNQDGTSAGYCSPDFQSLVKYNSAKNTWHYRINGGSYNTLNFNLTVLQDIVGYTFDVPSTSDIPTTATDVGALPSSTTISIGGTITFGTGANVNTATFSSNKSISAMGNAARSGVSIVFWDSANSRMYQLTNMQHIADSGDIFTFINISSNVVHKIVTGTLDTYNSTSKTFTGTYSQLELSTFSGSYNDLSDKPTIPTNNNQLTNGAGYQTASDVSTAIATKQDTLPSGTAGQVLTLDSNLDPIWAQPSGGSSAPEIYVGSGTPAGYTLYIDPDNAMSSGEGVSF